MFALYVSVCIVLRLSYTYVSVYIVCICIYRQYLYVSVCICMYCMYSCIACMCLYCLYPYVSVCMYRIGKYGYIRIHTIHTIHTYAFGGVDMHTICTVHMCMYLTPRYKQYIHALFDTYRYAHAGSLMTTGKRCPNPSYAVLLRSPATPADYSAPARPPARQFARPPPVRVAAAG